MFTILFGEFHVLVVIFLLVQLCSTVQSKKCGPDEKGTCDVFIAWKGCYSRASNNLKTAFEYDEIFRDPPLTDQRVEEWRAQLSNLACRCANESFKWNYDYFALQFYSVCYGAVNIKNVTDRNENVCEKSSISDCKKKGSLCFRIGSNKEFAVYKLVKRNSKRQFAACSGNEVLNKGSYFNSTTYKEYYQFVSRNKTNDTDSKAALQRMFKQLDNCSDINQILKITKKIIDVFKRPEIYEHFSEFKELQTSFITTLSRIVGDELKYLWKQTLKVQYLVEMVEEMAILTLRSLSFTNKTEYSFQTLNIDIAANVSGNEETSLYFNDSTTTGSFIILDNSLRGVTSGTSSVAAILYKNIDDIFPAKMTHDKKFRSSNITFTSAVVSPVFTIVSMCDGKLTTRVNATIRLTKMAKKINSSQTHSEPVCGYWKENTSLALGGVWSTSGLSLIDSHHGNESSTVDYFKCRTNHLTSFAVLMQVAGFEIPPEHQFALEVITYFGCSISLLCLLVTIITLPIIRLKETRFRIHLHLCIALAASQAIFLVGTAAVKNKTACMVTALFLHYFYTAAFMWMLVEGIHLYQKIVIAYEVQNIKEELYFIFAWGFPFFIVGIAFAANRNGYGTKRGCWLSLDKGFRWAFITPVIGVLLANTVILIKVLTVMVTLQSDPHRTEKYGKLRLACKGVAILLPLLGLTWIFGVLSVNSDTIVFQYLFAIFSSLQGAFIFFFNYISNKEVRNSFRRTIHRSQMTSLM